MHTVLEKLTAGYSLSGLLAEDVATFLNLHGLTKTAKHSAEVADKAYQLALRFGLDCELAFWAGWLHDVSAVIPNAERLRYARILELDIIPEEIQHPMILHQKLSRVFALEIFDVGDIAILNAVECHTTLKRNAKPLDKILFVADKLAWDQVGTPPYAKAMNQALRQSLDTAVCVYMEYIWRQREFLPVIHPWLVAATEELCKNAAEELSYG